MLDNMGSIIGTWKGLDAKWIDSCESSSSSNILVKTWELSSEEFTHSILGYKAGESDSDLGCISLFEWSDWAPYLAQMGINAAQAMNY